MENEKAIAENKKTISENKKTIAESEKTISSLQNLAKNILSSRNYYKELYENITENTLKIEKHNLYLSFIYVLKLYYFNKVIEEKHNQYKSNFQLLKDSYKLKKQILKNKLIQAIENYEYELSLDEYKNLRRFITKDEFIHYPSYKRLQIAFDRYNKLNKTESEIGLIYERFIGYIYEMEGYTVRYHGALNKLRDKGIDLIADRRKEHILIQCKNWNKNSVVRENVIRNLQGSVDIEKISHPRKIVKGILYTSTSVSNEAKKDAEKIGIEIKENFELTEYPKIKCNISTTGEKIYHMPFDLHYDKVFIKPKDGDMYAWTTEEAELFGFRHAHRWQAEK